MRYMLIFVCVSALSLTSCSDDKAAVNSKQQVKNEKKQTQEPELHDETDKTDIFAIPLDESEMDEEADKK